MHEGKGIVLRLSLEYQWPMQPLPQFPVTKSGSNPIFAVICSYVISSNNSFFMQILLSILNAFDVWFSFTIFSKKTMTEMCYKMQQMILHFAHVSVITF